jgi:1-acyl-sn-glycerol-3-phosphate acyltransferase
MEPVYRSVTALALATFRVLRWDVRTSRAANIPRRGPGILAANHIGFLDFVFLGAGARFSGRRVRFMARHDAFEHWLGGPLLRAMKHIPVDRDGDPAASFGTAARALQAGEIVGIHPEGAMSRSLVPQPAKSGAARLALATGAPLIPAAVWGSQRILAKGHLPRFPRGIVITVDYGEPIAPQVGEDPAALTARLMERVETMVRRGAATYPQRPRDAEDRWWLPAHLGGTALTVEESLARTRADVDRRRERRGATPQPPG